MMEVNEITYKVNLEITAKDFSNVFKSSGIKRPVDDLERLQKMIDNADILITAWDADKLVGVARAITDYSYCCYLSDLAVNSNYQSKGIGRQLVQWVQKEIGDTVTLLLLSAPSAMDYYPKIGFESIDNGFKILRKS
ncbi:GNAT family N-acetyltransferase [Aquibacillus rhizosphaerae]|uniref:GNAT family N-acetyltransferase n=1 Tax=Aquibacillus rhizosphaerae TaxID=3051431 RepID=A0ABT7L8X0_9BACI|nr:GNAT family N-acetyltransferase [Aquibacillus sp. LR5S19]MDL4842323.1 GNAT family N-acetyltransferase [Aquibacillus sp. LR5S19]